MKQSQKDKKSSEKQALTIALAGLLAQQQQYYRAGQHREVIRLAEQALAIHPGPAHADFSWLAAQSARRLGLPLPAEKYLRLTLSLQPRHAEAHNSLGLLCLQRQQVEEAVGLFRRALVLKPDFLAACKNLGTTLREQDRLPESVAVFRQALALAPNDGYVLDNLVLSSRKIYDWSQLEADEARLRRLLDSGVWSGITPLTALALEQITPAQHYTLARLESATLLNPPPPVLCQRRPQPRERLRVGYLSADFHAHPTTFLFAGVLEEHRREQVEIFLYSYGPDLPSADRERLRVAGTFRDIAGLGDLEAARRIAADEIDILVEMKGHTFNARLGISALRPAPILLSWLGYPGTLGQERLADYIIGDATVTPLSEAAHYSEKLALMPHCYQPNDRRRRVAEMPTRAEAGLPEAALVLCNFNQSYKTTPSRFALWCRLLQAVPGSVLWLLSPPHASGIANLQKEAVAHGIDPQRLIFAPNKPQDQHLARLQLADIALDTLPYTSHTTASDVLWAGVPLLTRIGESFASRVAASILRAAGFGELVCESDEDYFERVVELASGREQLAALKQRVLAARLSTPLFDTAGFAHDLEGLYQRIWVQECEGRREHVVLKG